MMTSQKLPANYQPTLEDALAIQEYFDACAATRLAQQRAQQIAATDTVSFRRPQILVWDREPSFAEKVAKAVEEAHS